MKFKLLIVTLVAILTSNSYSATAIMQGETSPGVYTNVAVNSSGVLSVSTTGGGATPTVSQGSTTSGQSGNLVQGAVTTSAPTYITGNTNPLSLTTTGALRVDNTGSTQPISGTVTVTQATGSNLHTVIDSGTVTAVTAITNALPAGTNSIGKVVPSVPNATTVTILTQQTNATGTTYNAFGSNSCTALDLVNNTGTVMEYQRGGSGSAIPIQAGGSRLVIGITNSSSIGVRRTDTSNTQVTIAAECIVN